LRGYEKVKLVVLDYRKVKVKGKRFENKIYKIL